MTTIATYIENEKIFIICDTQVTFGSEGVFISMNESKFIKVEKEDKMYISISGDGDVLFVLKEVIKEIELPNTFTEKFIRLELIKLLKEKIKEYIEPTDVSLMLSTKHGIYYSRNLNIPIRVEGNFFAIGSGSDLAIGALRAIQPFDLTPNEKLIKALNIASEYDIYTNTTFYIEEINSADIERISLY